MSPPSLLSTFSAERAFVSAPYVDFAARTWPILPFAIAAVYVLLLVLGPRAMAHRKPFPLRTPLIAWNALLSLFSLVGFLRTGPHLLHLLREGGLHGAICRPAQSSFGDGAVGLWVFLFVASKVPELLDTAFLVLRKKRVPFIHAFHHVTVLLFVSQSYATRSSCGIVFATVNALVHFLMYAYFGLAAAGYRRVHSVAPLITALQIAQMLLGCAVLVAAAAYRSGGGCAITLPNLVFGLAIYGSYLVLFSLFFVSRHCGRDGGAGRGGGDDGGPVKGEDNEAAGPTRKGPRGGTSPMITAVISDAGEASDERRVRRRV
jgi:elongation of very long chain fatty acids protein 6